MLSRVASAEPGETMPALAQSRRRRLPSSAISAILLAVSAVIFTSLGLCFFRALSGREVLCSLPKMAGESEAAQKLRRLLLADAKVCEPVVAYIMKATTAGGPGMESISDYASFFTTDDYAAGVSIDVLANVEAFKNDRYSAGGSALLGSWPELR